LALKSKKSKDSHERRAKEEQRQPLLLTKEQRSKEQRQPLLFRMTKRERAKTAITFSKSKDSHYF